MSANQRQRVDPRRRWRHQLQHQHGLASTERVRRSPAVRVKGSGGERASGRAAERAGRRGAPGRLCCTVLHSAYHDVTGKEQSRAGQGRAGQGSGAQWYSLASQSGVPGSRRPEQIVNTVIAAGVPHTTRGETTSSLAFRNPYFSSCWKFHHLQPGIIS